MTEVNVTRTSQSNSVHFKQKMHVIVKKENLIAKAIILI